MSVLDQVIARLSVAAAVAIVNTPAGPQVFSPKPAEYYELPPAAWKAAS